MTATTLAPGDDAFDRTIRNQRLAADPALSAWVTANAGAGKTRVLIDRVTRLLLEGAPPSAVLCITYTKAAAAEMKTRLFARLGQWSVLGDEALTRELLELEGPQAKPADGARLARARRLFAQALETPGGLKIQTIHAFCERLLRQFPLEAGAPPGFEVLEEAEAQRLLAAARSAAILDPALGDALSMVAAATHDERFDRLLAEAVSERAALSAYLQKVGGLEPAIDQLYANLNLARDATGAGLRQGVLDAAPRSDLEWARSVLVRYGPQDDALAARISAFLAAPDLESAFAAYLDIFFTATGPRTRFATRKAIEQNPRLQDLFGARDGPPGPFLTALQAAAEAVKAADTAERSAALLRLSERVLADYERAKAARGAFDFDDLVARARDLLADRPSAAWVLYKLDQGIDHVLLDEAQDTAPEQWDLLNALTQEILAGVGAREAARTVFVVGDDKQSIYSFQGADPARFNAEGRAFAARLGARARTPNLNLSFRSAPEVLAAVDAALAGAAMIGTPPATDQEPVQGKDALRHVAFRAGQPGCVEWWPATARESPDTPDPWAPPSGQGQEANARNRLAGAVAHFVADAIRDGREVWDEDKSSGWRRRPMTAGDVMILVRKRGPFFTQIIKELKRRNVPVAGADRLRLAEELAVQDLLALAQFALLPEDDLTLATVLKGPLVGLTDDDRHIFPLAHDRGRRSLWERLQTADPAVYGSAKEFLYRVLGRVSVAPPFQFFAAALEELDDEARSGLERMLARLGAEARDPIQEFMARAAAHARRGAPSLQRFVQEIASDGADIKRELDGRAQEARVMTVHGAKGLEAPLVILPDTTQRPEARSPGLFISSDRGLVWSRSRSEDPPLAAQLRNAEDEAQRLEHLRLFYVALTRARDRLVICGFRVGQGEGQVHPGSWHDLTRQALEGVGVQIKTPMGEGLGLGEPPGARAAAPDERGRIAPPDWARAAAAHEAVGPRVLRPYDARDGDDAEPAISPLARDMPARYTRGTLIHTLLQHLPELPDETRALAAERYLALQSDLTQRQRQAIAAEALAIIEAPRFAALFGPGSRAEAAIIASGEGLPGGRPVNGRVDRLAVTDSEVLIVDYKTNRPPPATPEAAPVAYLAQLAIYRAVLRRVFPDRAVRCALVWTDGARIMEVPDSLLDQALKGLAAA
jgi:ATP-dependent helicase/nuclease subunit A